jgi:hypothetical protein
MFGKVMKAQACAAGKGEELARLFFVRVSFFCGFFEVLVGTGGFAWENLGRAAEPHVAGNNLWVEVACSALWV